VILSALCLGTVIGAGGLTVSLGGFLSPLAAPVLGIHGQGITGKITFFPISRLCSNDPALLLEYSQVQILLQPSSGLSLTIPANWKVDNCATLSGTFHAGLEPGTYSMNLTGCLYQPNSPGCGRLPETVHVNSGEWAQVEISLDTLIR
jgi:hypothetical protein